MKYKIKSKKSHRVYTLDETETELLGVLQKDPDFEVSPFVADKSSAAIFEIYVKHIARPSAEEGN